MKYILGLDIGTNSLGWYLLNLINGQYNIIDRGVTIFPIGTIVDPVKGLEKTKHAQRRGFRMTSRNRFRKKLRKWRLSKILKKAGLFPDRLENKDFHFKDTYKVKNHYQSFELYLLRKKALDTEIRPIELGRIFFLLNNYRGFRSSSNSLADEIDNKKNTDEGKVKGGIENLDQLMRRANARTYGEYFYKMHLLSQRLYTEGKWHNPNEPIDERALDERGNIVLTNSYGIRRENGRYTSRKAYENEFDLIWSEQKKYHGDILSGSKEEYEELKKKLLTVTKEDRTLLLNRFKETLYWQIKYGCIYYQRPLKSAKRYIGKCTYEKNKRTAPISALVFQSFRIWKQLADIRYTSEKDNIFNEPLPISWRKSIFEYLETNAILHLKGGKNKTGICELLDLDEKKTAFNFDNEENDKYIKGNTTYSALFNILKGQIYDQLKKDIDNQGNSKLEKLWHLLYMKKDDEWLRITLNDKTAWPLLSDEIIEALSEVGFEDGYASLSSKVLKKILPFMEDGDDEHISLQKAGYKEIDQSFDESKWKPSLKISGIKNGELRNPVVEKAVTETIQLVNSILKEYPDIDKSNWEVHIETTRELKKPKKEREKMRRENTAKDELRQEYARFLNEQRNSGKLKDIFKREVFKNDSIINKFELWLEMGGDKNDPDFEPFAKIAKLDFEKRIKHKLWLECNRVCPYTDRVISLTQLFSSDTEIEHIIPLSRSLDDSFSNKTLTFHQVNKEKGNKTALEFLSHDKKAFKIRIRSGSFSKEKQENFLKENVSFDFTHAQISNTSYIAKYVRMKIQEVCKPHLVYFTNGKVTAELRNNDWRLGNLLDKIRYEEFSGNNIDLSLRRFNILKKRFHLFYKEKNGNDIKLPKNRKDFSQIPDELIKEFDTKTNDALESVLDEIENFEAFRGIKGKKDRSDHRHHCLDALITALCSPSITKELSEHNATRESSGISLYNDNGELTRDKIELPMEYNKIKDSLRNILVVNKTNQRLTVAKKNKIKTSKGTISQSSKSIRASLHKDTYYGKLKLPALQGIDKPEAYVTRFNGYVWDFDNPEKLESIYDKNLREIIKRRIKWFKENKIEINKEAYEKYPLHRYSPKDYPFKEPENPVSKKTGKPLPVVKKIRTVYKNFRSIIELPKNKYADKDGSYIMSLYELKESNNKGKTKVLRDFKLLSTFEAVQNMASGKKLFPDEINKNGKYLSLMQDCPFLKQGDLVVLYENEDDKKSIDLNNSADIFERLYKISELGSDEREDNKAYAVIKLVKHNLVKSSKEKYSAEGDFLKKSQTINAIKVKLNALGKIERVYSEK